MQGRIDLDALLRLHELIDNQRIFVTAIVDLADGKSDTPEGEELIGCIEKLTV